MNILALNWNDLSNPYAGGAEVHLEELLRRLVSYGHNVTLFCSAWPGAKPEETIEGIRIIRRGSRYNFNLVASKYLKELVARNNFDVLIEDINKIPFYTPRYLDIKTLVVIPHLFATTVFHEINFIMASYIYLAERPVVRYYRGLPFNVISESTRQDLIARGIPGDDISVIHCGIDRTVYSHDPAVTKYDRPTILYLGRLKKYKSVQHLIKALPLVKDKVPGARLMVVGEGSYRRHLEALAGRLGLDDDIEFPGYVPVAEKVERMRRSHVAVLPSLKEGWGLTNIEANAVGTTVVAADSPGLRDSVVDGETGLLYPYGNVDHLADRLISILTDDQLRRKLQEGALRWAAKFNWDDAAREFDKLLRTVAGTM